MAKELTCTFRVNGKRVESLTAEHIEKIAEAFSECLSEYYTLHPEEYVNL